MSTPRRSARVAAAKANAPSPWSSPATPAKRTRKPTAAPTPLSKMSKPPSSSRKSKKSLPVVEDEDDDLALLPGGSDEPEEEKPAEVIQESEEPPKQDVNLKTPKKAAAKTPRKTPKAASMAVTPGSEVSEEENWMSAPETVSKPPASVKAARERFQTVSKGKKIVFDEPDDDEEATAEAMEEDEAGAEEGKGEGEGEDGEGEGEDGDADEAEALNGGGQEDAEEDEDDDDDEAPEEVSVKVTKASRDSALQAEKMAREEERKKAALRQEKGRQVNLAKAEKAAEKSNMIPMELLEAAEKLDQEERQRKLKDQAESSKARLLLEKARKKRKLATDDDDGPKKKKEKDGSVVIGAVKVVPLSKANRMSFVPAPAAVSFRDAHFFGGRVRRAPAVLSMTQRKEGAPPFFSRKGKSAVSTPASGSKAAKPPRKKKNLNQF
ncbi:hypothetical protein HDU96_001464 [Phlyctochytrium bullatum]|nr:hypothetical protein HDU96_001464 [Phlyctochytrium bullatum]